MNFFNLIVAYSYQLCWYLVCLFVILSLWWHKLPRYHFVAMQHKVITVKVYNALKRFFRDIPYKFFSNFQCKWRHCINNFCPWSSICLLISRIIITRSVSSESCTTLTKVLGFVRLVKNMANFTGIGGYLNLILAFLRNTCKFTQRFSSIISD